MLWVSKSVARPCVRRQSSFRAGVTATDDDHIEFSRIKHGLPALFSVTF